MGQIDVIGRGMRTILLDVGDLLFDPLEFIL